MKAKKVLLLSVALPFLMIGCLRGGAPGNPNAQGSGGNPGISSAPVGTSTSLASSLASGNLDSIEKSSCPYCEWSGKNASAGKSITTGKDTPLPPLGSGDAAFGCFLVQMSKLFESAPATDFLAAFGEPAIHVQADILDKTNPNALCAKLSSMHPKKFYLQFPKLPFNSYHFTYLFRHRYSNHPEQFFREILQKAKNNGIAISRLQNDLFALDTQLSQLIELLAISRAEPAFSFTIPKEACQVSRDIVVNKIDLEGFNGILGGLKFSVNLLHAYTIGLDPARFIRDNGGIYKSEFVADANGVGGDNKKFAELIAGRGNLSSLQPLILSSLNSVIVFLDRVHARGDSQVFGYLLEHRFRKFFANLNKASKDLKYSLEHPGGLNSLTQLGHPSVKVDVNGFLSHLPDPKAINNADPFVDQHIIHQSEHIRGVASFWKALLNGIASF